MNTLEIIEIIGILTPFYAIVALCWYKTMKHCSVSRCVSIDLFCGLLSLKRLPLSDTVVSEILNNEDFDDNV
jgi:hypothetical protein